MLNGKSDVLRPFSISNFDNYHSLDRANFSNSLAKHSTIVSISSVLNCVFERMANQICKNKAKNFVSNCPLLYFSSSKFETEKQKSDSASLHNFISMLQTSTVLRCVSSTSTSTPNKKSV